MARPVSRGEVPNVWTHPQRVVLGNDKLNKIVEILALGIPVPLSVITLSCPMAWDPFFLLTHHLAERSLSTWMLNTWTLDLHLEDQYEALRE